MIAKKSTLWGMICHLFRRDSIQVNDNLMRYIMNDKKYFCEKKIIDTKFYDQSFFHFFKVHPWRMMFHPSQSTVLYGMTYHLFWRDSIQVKLWYVSQNIFSWKKIMDAKLSDQSIFFFIFLILILLWKRRDLIPHRDHNFE